MKQGKKLAVKLTIRIGGVLLFIFAIIITTVAANTAGDLRQREMEKLELLAQENATIAKDYMETMINKQEAIVAAIEAVEGTDTEKARYIERLLDKVGAMEDDILSLFFVSEPNEFISATPEGWSAFASKGGVHTQDNLFQYVTESIYLDALENGELTVADPHSKTIDGKSYAVITVFPSRTARGA